MVVSLALAFPLTAHRMSQRGARRDQELLPVGNPAVVFPPGHCLLGNVNVGPGGMIVRPDLRPGSVPNAGFGA